MIAGVAVPETSWRGLAQGLNALKSDKRFNIGGEIKWRFFGEQNGDVQNPISHLSKDAKHAFRTEFFGLLTARPEIKIIACVTSVVAAYRTTYVNSDEDLYEYTYKPVSERFQYYLQECGSEENPALGIMICDHRGRKQDERLRNHHEKLVTKSMDHFSAYENFVETLFLAPSHQSVGIQFADMVAGAVGRYFNSKDQTYAKLIVPCFRTGPGKKIQGFGLVKFPKASWV